MIVVTGAAGFIGSCLVGKLNSEGYKDIIVVDDFSRLDKTPNLANKTYSHKIERSQFFEWLDANEKLVYFVFHIGARTDTTEFDTSIFDALNVNYSKEIWKKCCDFGI